MKFYTTRTSLARIMMIVAFCFACSDPEEEAEPEKKEEEEEEPVPVEDVGKLLKTLSFVSAEEKDGELSAVTKSGLTKTDSQDTVYAMKGAKTIVRISHAEGLVAGIYIASQGGNFYYDVPLVETDGSDTVSTIIFEADPGDIQLPYDLPVDIVPYDQSKNPIDLIERTVHVEEPSNDICDLLIPRTGSPGDTTGLGEWVWLSTIVTDHNGNINFLNAPGKTFATRTVYEGCCDPNRPEGKCHPLSTTLNARVDVRIVYSIQSETFSFFNDGSFARQTYEIKRNFNPETTDWCAGAAGYTKEQSVVNYFGEHDFVPGDSDIRYVTRSSSCDLCGYGSRGGKVEYGCEIMIITVAGLEGSAGKEVRTYGRHAVNGWFN